VPVETEMRVRERERKREREREKRCKRKNDASKELEGTKGSKREGEREFINNV